MPSIELSQSAYDELKKHFIDKQYKANIKNPLLPDGWIVLEDVPQTLNDDSQLEFLSFLKDDEKYINGDTMRERAKEMNTNLGLADAQYLLDNQSKIPVELRDKYIAFPGTLVRAWSGSLRVAFLYWRGTQWELYWYWLVSYYWNNYGLIARSKSLYTQ